MPEENGRHVLQGRCHCKGIGIEFTTAKDPASFHPRACDCSFCCKHGAAWLSDPDGRLVFTEHRADVFHEYRQGSESARFLLCGRCGVCVGVVYEEGSQHFAAVNARCLDDRAEFGDSVAVSPQTLGADEKIARWKSVWVADVALRRVRG
ncbi:MAG TPA: aldehyde-activating protein [Dokdonella sp.]|jgi:hypothetical protein|nr:aldehyde-activating protein [Dokdonella sp.]